MRLGADPYMDQDKRGGILLRINNGRAKEARVSEVLSVIPSWATEPFKTDQANFNAAFKVYQENSQIVRTLESRLMQEPGPIWRDITPQEEQALAKWSSSLDSLYAYVNTYFPSETQKFWEQVVLGAIALGAFLAPLFLSKDDEGLRLPFSLEPLPLPWVSKRVPKGARREAAPTTAAIPVRAEVFRPGLPPAWRRTQTPTAATRMPFTPVATPAGTAPAFRSFAKPLGPSIPVTSATVRAQMPTATTTMPTGGASPIQPRFRKE